MSKRKPDFVCKQPELLIRFIENEFSGDVQMNVPTALQTQFDFDNGLVVNVYNTGTVLFQGSPGEDNTGNVIKERIKLLNEEFKSLNSN
jgi:hypothetical protein